MSAPTVEAAWLAASVPGILTTLWVALQWCRRHQTAEGWAAACIFLAIGLIYLLSSLTTARSPLSGSQFPHYARLAEALLQGRLDLQEPLFEVATHQGRIYVLEPLGPAIFMLPFVAIWGRAFSDTLFLILVGALNAALVFRLWPKVMAWHQEERWPAGAAYWLTGLFALGTPHWYLAIAGRVWHVEGVMTACCVLVAIHEALGRGRVALVHAWLGFSFLCHPPMVFSAPFFWLVLGHRLYREGRPPGRILRSLGGGVAVLGTVIAVGWGWYNTLRFGNPFEAGQTQVYLSDVAHNVCPPYGLMSLQHMPRHIWTALLRPPLPLRPHFPFLGVDYHGFSLFWTTPAFLYIFLAGCRRLLSVAAWSGAVLVLCCLLLYHHHGATQFGYRWVLDVLPFLLILAALGMQRCRWRMARPLIVLSVGVNLIGVIWFYTSH